VARDPGVRKIAKSFLAVASLLTIAAGSASSSATGAATEVETPRLVVLDPIVVPIVASGHMDGALRLKLVLSAKDEAGQARLTEKLPELRAASVAGAIEFARLYASPLSPIDALRLSHDLQAVVHAQDNDVERILIVEVAATS